MSHVPYIRMFADDWLSILQDLDLEERGVLMTIVLMTPSSGAPPIYDLKRLSRRLGCTQNKARIIIERLIEAGKITIGEGRLVNECALKELQRAQAFCEKQSESAKARWKDVTEKTNEISGEASAVALPPESQTSPEPDTLLDSESNPVQAEQHNASVAAGQADDVMRAPSAPETRLSALLHSIGANAETATWQKDLSVPLHWLANGCDLEADILPILRMITLRGVAVNSWNYYTEAVFSARDARCRPARPVSRQGPVQAAGSRIE